MNKSTSCLQILIFILICIGLTTYAADAQDTTDYKTIVITFKTNYTIGKDFFYKEVNLSENSQTKLLIDSKKIDVNFKYGIIQVHSFLYNTTLSYTTKLDNEGNYNGTNLGLTFFNNDSDNFTFYISNLNKIELKAAIIAILYGENAPIPGGCSGSLKVPSLSVHYNSDMVEVITPKAAKSINEIKNLSLCDIYNKFEYKSYYFYLNKNDIKPETYFNGIKKMIETTLIEENGKHASLLAPGPDFRIVYVATPGTGMVFNTIVKNSDGLGAAAYIPTVSYSCNPIHWQNDCQFFPNSHIGILITSFLAITGILKAFIICAELNGIELILNCFPLWAYLFYTISSIYPDMSDNTRTWTVITLSIIFSLITYCLTASCSLEVAFAVITKVLFASIFAIYLMFFLSQLSLFAIRSIYWICFSAIFITFLITAVPFFRIISFILSTLLGITAIVVATQIHYGSHMILIPLAHFRRIKNSDYGYANGTLTLDTTDYIIFTLGAVLFILGIIFQKYKILSFGSNENNNSTTNERTPLITRWTNGSDDVFETPNTNYRYFRQRSLERKRRRRRNQHYR